MRDLVARLATTIPRVRKRTDDEAIHDMRVALRRLRVVLKIARRIFGRYYVDSIRDVFTRVHRASGALRDEEVLRETLTGLAVTSGELDAWITKRAKREQALRVLVEKRLRAGDLRRPMRVLDALLALPVAPGRRRPLAVFARRAVVRARADVNELRGAETNDSAALHELRIAFKRLRYTTEIFRAALPRSLATLAEPAAQFQKRLGEIHDLDVARGVISRSRTLSASVKHRTIDAIDRKRARKVALYTKDTRLPAR